MPQVRDFLWALVVCVGLTLAFHYRPLWDARRFVQHESQAGFEQAYEGHRWVNGQLVGSGATGAKWDPMAPAVLVRRLNIEAEHVTWNGARAAFVVRHIVVLHDGSPGGEDTGSEIHVEIEKTDDGWKYGHFQERDRDPIQLPAKGNPWAAALRASARPALRGTRVKG